MAGLSYKLLYLLIISIVVTAEHLLFAERWRRYELARRTMGIATILGLAFPLAVAGVLDLATWVWMTTAFGVAGAVTAGLYTVRAARRDAARAAAIQEQINVVTIEQR